MGQLQGLEALSKVGMGAAGSCLSSALVAFTCLLYTPPDICAAGYNQTAHFVCSLLIQQKHIECFPYAMACTYPGLR